VKIVLYGAGGHGRVVADILAMRSGFEVVGFLDDDGARRGKAVGSLTVLGGMEQVETMRAGGVTGAIVTIGANAARMSKASEMEAAGLQLCIAIHPAAVVARDAVIGAGTVLMAGAVVNTGARIGRNVIVNTGATIDHDCNLGDGVHVSPGANLAGNVDVGTTAQLGIGCCVIPGIRIGAGCTAGAGAVVVRDIPDGETWAGNPARKIDGGRDEEARIYGPA